MPTWFWPWRARAAAAAKPTSAGRLRFYRLYRALFCLLAGVLLLALLWPNLAVKAAPTDLLFSEYIVAPGSFRALEIFNGTASSVDLYSEGYEIQIFFDGASEAGVTIPLTGPVASGDVYVLALESADPFFLAAADQTCTEPFFDGNDAVALHRQGIIIDVIGQVGFNPGSAWGSDPVSTQGNILRRKPEVTSGDTNPTDSFDPALEWEGCGLDSLAGLGRHTLLAAPALSPTVPGAAEQPAISLPSPGGVSPPPSGEPALPEPETPAPAAPAPPSLPAVAPAPTATPPPETPPSPADANLPASAPTPAAVLISEFLYAGLTPSTEGDEFVELCNPGSEPADLTGYKVADGAPGAGGNSMYQLRSGVVLPANTCLLIAKNAYQFDARFGLLPDFELVTASEDYGDHIAVLNLLRYPAGASRAWALANTGGELLLLGPNDEILDSAAYGNGNYVSLGLAPGASAGAPYSLQRIWPTDTNSMAYDFVRALPSPGRVTVPPAPPPAAPPSAPLPGGMQAFWGHLHAHTSYSDGAGPPSYALAVARAAGLHFYAITDPATLLTPEEWADTLLATGRATVPGSFLALRGLEWRHDTAGHITIFNGDTLVSPADPRWDTLTGLYAWLAADPGAIAQFNHPGRSAFDNFAFDPAASPRLYLQEIGRDVGGKFTSYEAAFLASSQRGWQVAPTMSGGTLAADWGMDTSLRTGVVAPALTPEDLLAALRARRLFATEDPQLALALRIGGAWMGSVLTATGILPVTVDIVDPDSEPLTLLLYDGGQLLAEVPWSASLGPWTTEVSAWPGHYFWLKVAKADGRTAYSAPIWVQGQAPPDSVYLNEILPSPRDKDWNQDGTADSEDEWIELFNPTDHTIDLAGWRMIDASGRSFTFPPRTLIPAAGFATFYRDHTGLTLNNDQETLTLFNPLNAAVDSFSYANGPGPNGCWCRLPDGAASWSDLCDPSPGAANREKTLPGPLTANIFDAKRLTPGAWVRVKGRVTAPPGVLGARYMVIQDSTSGILIYLSKDHRDYYNLGDRVQVEGKLRLFHEEFQISVTERDDVEFLEPGQPPPPLPIATTSMLEPYEGLLVMMDGWTTRFEGRGTLWLDDGTGEAKVTIRASTGIKKPWLNPNTPATIVGIVSQYSDGAPSRYDYQLLPRCQDDLLLSVPRLPPPGWPTTLPETGARP